jgi:peroxiredoxin
MLRVPALAACLLLCAPALAAEPAADALAVGQVAPAFTLKTMNPERAKARLFALRQLVGEDAAARKTVVLSFAASYCEPCKRELAELVPLAPAFEKANVVLAVVVIDTEPDGIEEMKKLTVDTLALPYPVLSDRFGVLARRYQADQLPKTVVVAPDGKVTYIATGFKKDALQKLKTHLGV